ncbi:MAG: family 16 glycoside hydrolase [Planctomycetota bacterium]
MKKVKIAMLMSMITIMAFNSTFAGQDLPTKNHPATDVYNGWRVATQAYSFNRFTFYEAIDKTASLGLDWIEAYPGQSLSKENADINFDHDMPIEHRKDVKEKLKQAGIKLINYGVVDLPNNEEQCRKVFEFAKDMGIETIVSEPSQDVLEMIDKLCNEYDINMAIHNHPKPTRYWNPDTVLKACQGCSKRIGACADTGHWTRSGVNPLEALKKMESRIISLHFKDLNEFGNVEAHDVPWGSGVCNVKAMLEELHRQNYEGTFSIEYEYNWDNSVPEIRQCVGYFNEVSGKLKPSGWKSLLEKDLSNAVFEPGTWKMEDGILTAVDAPDLWTKERYGDFVLDLEFKTEKEGNSGVFIRTGSIENWLHTAIEIQIHDSTDGTPKGMSGAVYDCLAPSKNVMKSLQWNRYTITCKENKIYVVMNGEQIIDMDLNLWTEPHKNPDGSKNKFITAYKDMPREGHVGFQYHGDPVWFRNIKIRQLD